MSLEVGPSAAAAAFFTRPRGGERERENGKKRNANAPQNNVHQKQTQDKKDITLSTQRGVNTAPAGLEENGSSLG